jgi:GT2 family glycosyltransferase
VNLADFEVVHRAFRLAVVVPVKDELHHTRRIVQQAAPWPTLVIDNGSEAETADYLASQQTATVYRMPGAGIHEMWNTGVDWALHRDAEVVAILNNDLEFSEDAIWDTAKAVKRDPDLIAACPNYDNRPGTGVQYVEQICAGRYNGTGGLAGFAMFIDADIFRAGYRFPPKLTWWYGDNDLLLTILTNGRKAGIVLGAHVEHLDGGGQTGDWESSELAPVLAADRDYFLEKWGARAS